MTDVLVLHAALRDALEAGRAAWLLERLPYARRLDLERRDDAARSASLIGLELLVDGVTRLRGAPPEWSRLRFPTGGRPQLENGPWFSVSHSATRVAVALSEVGELGFDLEDVHGTRLDRAALARWTAVEASLKATGSDLRQARDVRLAADLATAELAGRRVHLQHVALQPDCVACLATLQPVAGVVVEAAGRGKRMVDGGGSGQ